MNKWHLFFLPSFLMIAASGCNKSDFLDKRPDNSLIVPSTLQDVQEMLDNDVVMNGFGGAGLVPALGETGSDNYYLTDTQYNSSLPPLYRNCYIWNKQLYGGEDILDWNFPYRCVLYSNIVLEALEGISPASGEQAQWNEDKGAALFHRAHSIYQVAQVFAAPYDSAMASTLPGVPLRMQADIHEVIQRGTLSETYQQIIADLTESIRLLPVITKYKTRPSRPAAYALLARVCQTMEEYPKSLLYADSCLSLSGQIMDYNDIANTGTFPFSRTNEEVLFNAAWLAANLYPVTILFSEADTALYRMYDGNDLRKELFFTDIGRGPSFRGTYDQDGLMACGPATDEVMLIKAECLARAGETSASMKQLNTLLIRRYRTGTFIPLIAIDADDALHIVLQERRKELLMRALRWTDLRRLNKDPRFAVTLTRVVNGVAYTLPPNDARYTYSIPDKVIQMNPGMEQNAR